MRTVFLGIFVEKKSNLFRFGSNLGQFFSPVKMLSCLQGDSCLPSARPK